jgi:hypothetical protein
MASRSMDAVVVGRSVNFAQIARIVGQKMPVKMARKIGPPSGLCQPKPGRRGVIQDVIGGRCGCMSVHSRTRVGILDRVERLDQTIGLGIMVVEGGSLGDDEGVS